MPIKDAVVTSSLSPRWRYLWTYLQILNFDYKGPFERADTYVSEFKYGEHVNAVIQSYNNPKVHFFRIHFFLTCFHDRVVDKWLRFALKRKVEILELDLETTDVNHHSAFNYDFPSRLQERNSAYLFDFPYSDMVYLKKLHLNNVNVKESGLEELLTHSPLLETISIHGSGYLINIRVGGRHLNLKHFEIMECPYVESIYLSDFNLESFTYMGGPIDFKLTRLPNLKNVVMSQGLAGLHNNVFSRISCCASSLQKGSKLGSVICPLPNVKKLTLTIVAVKDNCLLEFASIVNAFPKLETFIIELLWSSPIKRRRKAIRIAADRSHEHLKVQKGYKAVKDFKKNEEAARASAQRQLPPLLPHGVELVIL
ncbi:F-box protein At5g03100-like [Bidens hawaiensis]|uniref:F-box protein At5g03100-like n=1 Tax=Bidens hawaiensis TaxID=980011 RepID=UPI00404A8A9F